jgi:hypothetical protein
VPDLAVAAPVSAHECLAAPPGRGGRRLGHEPPNLREGGELTLGSSGRGCIGQIAERYECREWDARTLDDDPLARSRLIEELAEAAAHVEGADGLHLHIIALI